MVTPPFQTSTQPSLRGRWTLYGIYTDSCPPLYAGQQFLYNLNFNSYDNGEFKGLSLENIGASIWLNADGHLNDQRIFFTVECKEFPQGIICKGNWLSSAQQFAGTWRTTFTDKHHPQLEGEWILDYEDVLPLFADSVHDFSIRYEPEQLNDIFNKIDHSPQDGQVKYQAFATLSIILGALAILARLLIGNNSSFILNICFYLLILTAITSFYMYYSQYIYKRKRLKDIQDNIQQLCADPDIEIVISNNSIIKRTRIQHTQWSWQEITDFLLHDKAIILGTDKQSLLIPKSAISDTQFDQLSAFVHQQLITQKSKPLTVHLP